MSEWTLTFNCTAARRLAEFWKVALGYVDAPPPQGWTTWEDWLRDFDVPEDEWDDGAAIVDPAGGTVLAEVGRPEQPDHVVMADPEGNEFCVV